MTRIIFEKSKRGVRRADIADFTGLGEASPFVPPEVRRTEGEELDLPEVSEVEVVRHYLELAHNNFGVDTGFYPLGSCTMKYNPKLNEELASLPGFTNLHPSLPIFGVQGALQVMWELSECLKEISGMDAVSLQPAAGAQGELTGMLISKAYFRAQGEDRDVMVVPDSAHGTNPASASVSGFIVKTVRSDKRGMVSLGALKEVVDEFPERVAGIMLTNPNTLGVFESDIKEISDYLHAVGALLYYDGANLNPLLGYARPGDMGFDIVHFNLHKTFSTPHGGGGPGAGPVGVKKRLEEFLPSPIVVKVDDRRFEFTRPRKSIGKMKLFYGNFLVLLRAYVYIRTLGADGLKRVAEHAVLNANYVQERLKDVYEVPYYQRCMHEFVISLKKFRKDFHVGAKEVAKKLLENGIHSPTVYFPLIVEEAMMIEPTETESKERLDEFCDLMLSFAKEISKHPEDFKKLEKLDISGFDETDAARNPILTWMAEREARSSNTTG